MNDLRGLSNLNVAKILRNVLTRAHISRTPAARITKPIKDYSCLWKKTPPH